MEKDLNQTKNIAAEKPDVVAELDHYLMEWICRATTGPAAVTDPFQEQLRAGVSPDMYCSRAIVEERLRAVGRLDQLEDLKRRRDLAPPLRPW
jgi:hypothetical protein